MRDEGWAYVCGMCTAREAEFLPARSVKDLAALPPDEVSRRLARTFFGPAEPLSSFDGLARERRNREFDEIEDLSPESAPVDLARLPFAADEMRRALNEIPKGADAAELASSLSRLCLRAGHFADMMAAELAPPLPRVEVPARVSASLLVDSAELAAGLKLARLSGDELLARWAGARMRAASARVALRVVRLGIPREAVESFFFRGPLMTEGAGEFLRDYDGPAAEKLFPPGSAGREDEFLFELSIASRGEPFSAARVLSYLLGYLRQERLLRLSVYAALGRFASEEAA